MGEVDGTDAFNRLASRIDYPMFVVTTQGRGHPAGCLVGFASQTSIDPPRFLAGISRTNHTFLVARAADHLAVHVLPRAELDLARLFGTTTGDTTDKFARCRWHHGPHQMPILDAAAAWFVGKVLAHFDLGDHVGHLLEPVAGETPEQLGERVSFADVRDLAPGHRA